LTQKLDFLMVASPEGEFLSVPDRRLWQLFASASDLNRCEHMGTALSFRLREAGRAEAPDQAQAKIPDAVRDHWRGFEKVGPG